MVEILLIIIIYLLCNNKCEHSSSRRSVFDDADFIGFCNFMILSLIVIMWVGFFYFCVYKGYEFNKEINDALGYILMFGTPILLCGLKDPNKDPWDYY